MTKLWKSMFGVVAVMALVGGLALADAQSPVPAQSTGQCKDGTYTSAPKKWQACRGHQGVKSWFADAKPAGAALSPAATPAPAAISAPPTASSKAAAAPGGSAPATSTSTTAAASKAGPTPARTTAAPGGGPGMVWVNTSTNVYHCPGGKFYGKTKEGKYMSEADAKQAGARPDHNQACSK